jgi:hypothetical protein
MFYADLHRHKIIPLRQIVSWACNRLNNQEIKMTSSFYLKSNNNYVFAAAMMRVGIMMVVLLGVAMTMTMATTTPRYLTQSMIGVNGARSTRNRVIHEIVRPPYSTTLPHHHYQPTTPAHCSHLYLRHQQF